MTEYKTCMGVISHSPEIFARTHAWGGILNRLRAAGYITGDNSAPVMTADGIAFCKEYGIKTPAECAAEREIAARKQHAIDTLSGK